MAGNPSDGQLILRLQSGDLEALGMLYERHKTRVYRTALGITHDSVAAEDILQDCFLRFYRYAHRVDPSLPLEPWLYRVTTNLAYNWARKRKKGQVSLSEMTDWLAGPKCHSPEWQVEAQDERSRIMEAIATLKIKQRIVIVLYYLNALSVKEISTILECPVGTVKSRLYHGRKNLRRKLEQGTPLMPDLAYGFT